MTPLYDLNSPPSPFPLEDLQQQQQNSSSCSRNGDYESASDHNNNGSSVKWMSSKMMNSNCSTPTPLAADHNSKADYDKFRYPVHGIRVCSDCNTTTTPLWRSGPRGPKSLCNACGIRQRKARRALEAAAAAANGTAVIVKEKDATSMKIKVHTNKKEIKKSLGQYKKQLKANSGNNCHHQIQRQKKLCFKKFALSLSKNSALQSVFPQDVEEAAILLMELSCGLFS